jgi:2-keto-4-pentenoate hydratase/2-oxohepta-3-ene-1,7-dioic acid hydratase in catechol pathway
MKICRFDDNQLGLVEGEFVRNITPALEVLPHFRYPLPGYDPLIAHLGQVIERARMIADSAPRIALDRITLLSPVANAGKIIAAPVNYKKHLSEVLGDPDLHHGVQINHIQKAGLFLKAGSSLVGAGAGVAIGKPERRNDHEVELAVVIGKQGSRISHADALDYVAGYCIGLDITIRGPEERSFRKSPDSYTVLGPWLTTADEVSDPGALELSLSVNGEIRQKSNTADLIIDVAKLIEFASSFYTLYPGDIIFTGTPEGVNSIKGNDTIFASIERLGNMSVKVRAEG